MHKVLLVLDSENLATILRKELSSSCEVKTCDAATAVDMINHYRPDALILDLFLPGTDGFQILQNAAYSTPTIILLTLLVSSDILQQAVDLNIDCIFLKPFNLLAFTKRLSELLSVDIK